MKVPGVINELGQGALQPERLRSWLSTAFAEAGLSTVEFLRDDVRVKKAADTAYERIPLFPYRAAIRASIGQDGFTALVFAIRDRMVRSNSIDLSWLRLEHIKEALSRVRAGGTPTATDPEQKSCEVCGTKNVLRAKYCKHCGRRFTSMDSESLSELAQARGAQPDPTVITVSPGTSEHLAPPASAFVETAMVPTVPRSEVQPLPSTVEVPKTGISSTRAIEADTAAIYAPVERTEAGGGEAKPPESIQRAPSSPTPQRSPVVWISIGMVIAFTLGGFVVVISPFKSSSNNSEKPVSDASPPPAASEPKDPMMTGGKESGTPAEVPSPIVEAPAITPPTPSPEPLVPAPVDASPAVPRPPALKTDKAGAERPSKPPLQVVTPRVKPDVTETAPTGSKPLPTDQPVTIVESSLERMHREQAECRQLGTFQRVICREKARWKHCHPDKWDKTAECVGQQAAPPQAPN
jgi:hypothetical protein